MTSARPPHRKRAPDDRRDPAPCRRSPVLRFERHLAKPVEVVWNAVTDPDEMRAWFPTRIEIAEWKVGATLTHHFDEHEIDPLPGHGLEWDPPVVSFTWGTDTIGSSSRRHPMAARPSCSPKSSARATRRATPPGWDAVSRPLGDGTVDEGEPWKVRFDHYVALFEPTLGHQDGPPDGFVDPDA